MNSGGFVPSPRAWYNLVLTGFMGTGKTSVGREIAQRLGRKFVDMDSLIEAREGRSVPELFRDQGELYFRRLEAALCRELARTFLSSSPPAAAP
jgi:shikimate kinase